MPKPWRVPHSRVVGGSSAAPGGGRGSPPRGTPLRQTPCSQPVPGTRGSASPTRRLAPPRQPRLSPAASAGCSRRDSRGLWGWSFVMYPTPRGSWGRPWGFYGTRDDTQGTATALSRGVHTRVCRLGSAGRPGVFVGVQGLGVQGLTCNPKHACAGVCPAPRGRGVAGAVGVRGAHGCAGSPGSRGRCGCFLAHPLRQGLGRGTRGGTRSSCPHPGAVGAWTYLPGDTHAAPTAGTTLVRRIAPYWERWDEHSGAGCWAGLGAVGRGARMGCRGCEPRQKLGSEGIFAQPRPSPATPLLSAASGGPGRGDVTLWRGSVRRPVSRLVSCRATDTSCGCPLRPVP